MKKTLIFACLITLFSAVALAQEHKEKIRLAAQLIADATLKEDYSTVLDHTYPKFLEAHGGKDSVLKAIRESFNKMKEQGMELTILNITIGEPGNETKIGAIVYSIVPENLVLKINGKKYSATSSLIGVSSDDGKSWTFIDTGGGLTEAEAILPDIDKLSIPARTGPILITDN